MKQLVRQMAMLGCGLLLTLDGAALAQDVVRTKENLDFDRPEAWAMNYFTSIALLAGLGTPYSREPGSLEAGLELGWVPRVSKKDRRVGFNGVKEEDLNKAPILVRPRLTVGLPQRFALTLAYLPPIEVFGVRPHLFAFALERPIYEQKPWTVGLRAYGQVGTIKGDFTCPGEVVRFPSGSAKNLFGCETESNDKTTQRYGGLELSGSYRIDRAGGLMPYLAVAGNFLDTKFQVHARTFGFRDRRRLSADTWTFSVSTGVTYPLGERLSLHVGLFYSPLWVTRPPATSNQDDDLLNARALLTYRLF